MKHQKKNCRKNLADIKAALGKLRFRKMLCVFVGIGILAVGLLIWSSFPAAAEELAIPADYGYGYGIEKLEGLSQGANFEGIVCENKDKKIFTLQFDSNANGLVTLARISQNHNLEGYTFQIALGGKAELSVKYDENNQPISNGSFFGIGSDTYPFKGRIEVSGADDTYIEITGENSWRYFFNNLTNEAKIVPGGSSAYRLCPSAGSFVFCKKLTITKAGPLDISGVRFSANGAGDETSAVRGSGLTAVFAGEVVKGAASSFSVDLSSCFTNGLYCVESTNDHAGGLIATVNSGVQATITLPASLNFRVKAGGDQKNAGILIGSNNGDVTFNIPEENPEKTASFTGEVTATGSAGLIGANQEGSQALFSEKILIDGMKATGLRAGGLAGTGKGPITVKEAEISGSTFTKINSSTNGRLGGAIGSVDILAGGLTVSEGGSVKLLNNTFSAPNACYIGGYIGYLNTEGAKINFLTIENTTITGSGGDDRVGGYIGSLITSGDFSVDVKNNATFTFNKIAAGVCGGAIGEVSSSDLTKTVLLNGEVATLNCTVNGVSTAVVGGLTGKIASGYVRIDNLSLNNSIVRVNSAADLAGTIAARAMLDVGNITLSEANGSVLVAKTGQGSVVRLSGTINDKSASVLNLVYEQDASLIYKDEECQYSGKAASNNDIGNYGQVVRNDTLKVISFNATTHKVSIQSPLDASGGISVSGTADFAKLAITFHTKGSIMGVTGAKYDALFGKTINLQGDVSLDEAGIEQLTPSNDITRTFTGSLNGGGHTVALAIGQNISGGLVGVKAGPNNKRSSLGLFAALQNAEIKDVSIGGQISLCLPDMDQYVGSLAGKADGDLSIDGCTVQTEIAVKDGVSRKAKTTSLYAGGMVGCISASTSLSAQNCTLQANIEDSTTNTSYTSSNNMLWFGGFSGYVSYQGSVQIDFQNNSIQTIIKKDGSYDGALKIGGLIGELVSANYIKVDLSGTGAKNVTLTAAQAKVSAGGMLGHTFDKCHIILDKPYQGTVNAGSAALGGLLYTLNGRLTVEPDFSLDGTSLTATGDLKGLLLADGKQALVTVKASPNGFRSVTANGFDLFVGENIADYTSVEVAASGGIVTVETGAGLGKLPSSSDWYALMKARPNTKTRYYFNIAGLEETADVSEAIAAETDLLYWHVYDYAQPLPEYVKDEFFKTEVNNITSVAKDIDMTDYCFYPTKKEAVTIDFKGYKLTFGKTVEVDAADQFFGLQAGLLSDITDSGETTTVQISNIKLGGKVSHLGEELGSGALICGTVIGSNLNNNKREVNLTLSRIILSGLVVETNTAYRPMLINRVASYVDAAVTGISQESYNGVKDAASSLIGKGGTLEGSTPSSFVKMTFKNIVLDGKKSTTVFTRASLFDDVSYESGSGSFIYNFNFDEDWGDDPQHQVTYGVELYLNEDQREYFDREINVNPKVEPDEDSQPYPFQNEYLPYVYVGYNAQENKTNLNLSVNRKGADLTEGFGTYQNPYIIRTAKQLEYVSKLLSGNNETFNDGWTINFPQGNWSDVALLDLTGYYTVRAEGGKLYKEDEPSVELDREVLLSYLSGAYFKLSENTDLTLSTGYAGLGSADYPFHGVIHGNGNTVTMSSPDAAIGAYGYGFINVANGCALYDLTVKYNTIILSSDAFTDGQTQTSHPTEDTPLTKLPHFGGAIAWVVGGDNLLDNVTVTVTSVTPGACHTVCGGYVGLVSGGGVLLSDIKDLTLNDRNHLYHNNYVGRVLEGYAIAIDGETYDNSKDFASFGIHADFTIPPITKNTLTEHQGGYANGTFELATEEGLLLFSFGMNSGAFAGNTGYGYGKSSLSRSGDYSQVGKPNAPNVTAGRYKDDADKTSVIAKYFNVSEDLRKKELVVNLSAAEYDMTNYGNAFRGMNGVYGNSAIYQISSFGGTSNKATITLQMNMLQYAAGKKDDGNDASYFEADSIRNYGLFGQTKSTVTFKNLNLEGKLSVSCIDNKNAVLDSDPFLRQDVNKGCSVGGLVGCSGGAVTIQNTSLADITVNSPDICGGLVGRHTSGDLTVENETDKNSFGNLTVKGKRHTGGVAGYLGAGTASVKNLDVIDSVVEARVDLQYQSGTLNGTAGGVFGRVTSGATGVTIEKCHIQKTAIVYTANYKNSGDYVAAGGLVGIKEKDITVKDCTVDGCVILAVSKMTNQIGFPDELSPSKNNLSPDFRDNVVYNDKKQNVGNLVAWMLEQNAGDSNGYSVGAAGGLIGQVRSGNTTLSDCTVSADNAPSVIAGFNNAGGFVGEQRANAMLKVTNCTTKTGNHDMYIMGGPRAAGVIGYRSTGGTPSYTLDNVQITGTAEHPIRILGFKYSTSDAAGLFGDISGVELTVKDCKVSYCIIGGTRAAGAWSNAATANKSISFQNMDISNNLIYCKGTTYYAGGLICDLKNNSIQATVRGAYVGENQIVGSKGAGGLAGSWASGQLQADYMILHHNVMRKIADATNFTFAAKPLADCAAANALYNYNSANPNLTNVGLIAGNNSGTINAITVSVSTEDALDVPQKNFGTGTGEGIVVYSAYGAGEKYVYGRIDGGITPQQKAIEEMNYSATMADSPLKLFYGDSVTESTPQTISALKWWPYQNGNFSIEKNAQIKMLQELVPDIPNNDGLPLVCLSEKTDETMKNYLNLLTGGGFSAALEADMVTSINPMRYSADAEGKLEAIEGEGSVVYQDGKFKAGVYDNLEGESKTLTVLSITYQNGYTMDVAIYYHRAMNLKTFVVPLEGEQYFLPSFLTFKTEPSGSLKTNVSFGSPFTLYVEYNYNDIAMTLENINNFYKQIELTNAEGNSDENAKIEEGTQFVLIDLNSETPAGYAYYTLELDKDTRFIAFNTFKNGEKGFTPIKLTDLQTFAHLSEKRVCKDTKDCVYTEKYLLAVFPVQNNTNQAITYNMKAVIDEEQRQETNLVVKNFDVYGQVSVWSSPEVTQTPGYVDNLKVFSNLPDKPIIMQLNTTVEFANGYITALTSQNGAVYGTHILRLRNQENQYVELPMRTIVQVNKANGEEVCHYELTDAASQIRFSAGNILTNGATDNQIEMDYQITLDFSQVSQNDFNDAFAASGSQRFALEDSFYLSANSELLGSGPWVAFQDYTVEIESGIKLAVVPKDNRYLGINLLKPADKTNSGEIDFSVIARFDSFAGKTFEVAEVSFSVSKKVYDSANDAYYYVDLQETDTISWEVHKGNSVVNSDNLRVTDMECSGEYLLKVDVNQDYNESDLTNYRLNVTIHATAEDGITVTAKDYFVFLLCKLETEPPS